MVDMIDGRGRARITVFKHLVKSLENSRRSPELVPVQVSAEHNPLMRSKRCSSKGRLWPDYSSKQHSKKE